MKLFSLPVSLALLLLISLSQAPVIAQSSPSSDNGAVKSLKDEMRMPWNRNDDRYLRRWLVVGAFPSALDSDCLLEQGGEVNIRPGDGMAHRRADGTIVKWHQFESWGDAVNLLDAVDAPKDTGVAYAFASITRPASGKALLSVGSDEGVRVWVNGLLVLDRPVERSLTPDEDQVEIDLHSGENQLLVKVSQSWGPWTFCLRVLEPGAALPRRTAEIGPSLMSLAPGRFSIKTDIGKERVDLEAVRVEVVGAGGREYHSETASRGAVLGIDGGSWPDGPYEVRCTTRTLAGRLYATHLPWYKGDSLTLARELESAAAAADNSTPEGFTLKMLADLVRDRLGIEPQEAQGNPWWKIHSPLMEFQEMRLEARGEKARVRPHGFVRLAYRDEVDGSPQFCRAYLPANYGPARKWPLVLQLHGYNPANPPYVRWWSVDSRHPGIATEFADQEQVIYLEPHGRGNTSYQGLGDNDILRVIALAKECFAVDEDRVYLTGDSMGGWGTWNVATRHPHLFAAIAPVYGGADYHAQLTEEQLAGLSPVRRFQLEKQSSFAMADGLLNLPIFVHHGDVDRAVNVEYSRWAVRLLSRWGYDVRYREIPGRGHEALDVMNDIIEWFLKHRRNANPSRVRIRSAELRNASAYWARVEQAADPMDFMTVDAEIVGPNCVRLDTLNVLDIALSPSSALVRADRPLRVIWNGSEHVFDLKEGVARLRAAGYAPAEKRKSPELPGTMADFTSTPFAIVIGTASQDPEMVQMCLDKAEAFIRYWRQWQNQEPRVFKDSELKDSEAAAYSLLLIGGPEANRVTARLVGDLPLKTSPQQVVIGGRSFEVTDAAVQMIYPNPLNPGRYVLVAAGTSTDGMYFLDPSARGASDWDFVIVDGRVSAGGPTVPAEHRRVVSGLFDAGWSVRDQLLIPGDADLRAYSRLIRRPKASRGVNPSVFAAYVGRYQIEGGPLVLVTQERDRLVATVPGEAPMELVPESECDFFIKEGFVRLSFVKEPDGQVSRLTGEQNGREFRGNRLE
jgi:dienelactone hydrolase